MTSLDTASVPIRDAVPVVGIGASAGGLAATEAFLRGLPSDPGMAFVVVQHLAPGYDSAMAELLQAHTRLVVTQAEDGTPTQPDRVYTIPPGKLLTLEAGVLRLVPPEGARSHVPSAIDTFFRSLAADLGEAAACVVLSGTGTDGTIGMKAVKEAGGLTLVQRPEDAEYDGMPRSAVGTGLADIVGTPGELARRLVEFRRSAAAQPVPPEPAQLPEDGSAALGRVFAHLKERSGHDFTHYKRASVLRRLGRRLHVLGLPGIPEYVTYVRENPEEIDALFRDLLISVTNFFRDREAWDVVERTIVPALFAGRSADETVRVWVPGCATGEEAYSIAMLLCEHAARLAHPPAIQVFATDIDEAALAFARRALYPEAAAADLSPERLERHFVREAGGFCVRKGVRQVVLFAAHDLLRDAAFSRVDLVTCRNLLIYFNREVQERTFELFHYALRPDGHLFLGSSESAESADRLFAPLDKRLRIYRRRGTPARVPALPTVATVDLRDSAFAPRARGTHDRTLAERHRDWLLRERVPPSVVVDEAYEICHTAGGASRFLRELDGTPSRSLLDKVLPELRLDLRAAVYRAVHSRQLARSPEVLVRTYDGPCRVQLEVTPLDEQEFQGRYVEVLFRTVESGSPTAPAAPAVPDTDVAAQLEVELDRTRERLQTIIEEHETANEELKTSNEELQSINEELRSTTEELETGREELQSMNEELVTLNHELRAKVEELAATNGDLQNLMGAIEVGAVFLDRDLRITRYTPRAVDLLHLEPSDVGRPLRALTQKVGPGDIVQLARGVLRDLVPVEREQRADDGRWYLTRLRPYRTVDDAIGGVVLTCVDVTALKLAERQTRFQAEVLGQIHDAVVATDLAGRVVYLNAAAADWYGVAADAAIGKPLTDLVTIRYPRGESREHATEVLAREGEWRGDVEHLPLRGAQRQVEARVAALRDEHGTQVGTLGVLRDVTQRKAAEAVARETQLYLSTALRHLPVVATIVDTELRYR